MNPSLPRLEAPIVLAHGLLGFSRIEAGGITLASYFRRVPEILERAGNVVFSTSVPPTGSIEARAETLKAAMRQRFKEQPLHLVAHSMGGLDARHMITHLDTAGQVLSLTTLGTPHRGTVFADEGVEFADKHKLFGWLRKLGIPDDAFHQLRRDACHEFKPDPQAFTKSNIGNSSRSSSRLRTFRTTIATSESTSSRSPASSCSRPRRGQPADAGARGAVRPCEGQRGARHSLACGGT